MSVTDKDKQPENGHSVEPLTEEEEKKVNLRLQASFAKAVEVHPYLAMALYNMVRIPKLGLGTFATDKHWRFYYDPRKVLEWKIEEITGVILHEVRHCIHAHPERWLELKQPNHLSMIHNIATDSLINTSLQGEKVALPENCVTVESLQKEGFPVDSSMTSEKVYTILLEGMKDKAKKNGQGCSCDSSGDNENGSGSGSCPEHGLGGIETIPGSGGDCGSAAGGDTREYEEPNSGESEGVNPDRAENIRNKVAVEVRKHSQERGNVSSDLLRWADEQISPTINWRKELASLVRRKTATISGMKDYTYSRPSRRSTTLRNCGNNIILPAMRKPEPPNVAIVVDTSASISDEMLGWALGEIKGILETVNMSRNKPVVISCDATVGSAKKVKKVSEIELVGGGGTDMGIGIKAAMELKGNNKPEIIVVITDGYTPWPETPLKGTQLIIALTAESAADATPEWAKTIYLER